MPPVVCLCCHLHSCLVFFTAGILLFFAKGYYLSVRQFCFWWRVCLFVCFRFDVPLWYDFNSQIFQHRLFNFGDDKYLLKGKYLLLKLQKFILRLNYIDAIIRFLWKLCIFKLHFKIKINKCIFFILQITR